MAPPIPVGPLLASLAATLSLLLLAMWFQHRRGELHWRPWLIAAGVLAGTALVAAVISSARPYVTLSRVVFVDSAAAAVFCVIKGLSIKATARDGPRPRAQSAGPDTLTAPAQGADAAQRLVMFLRALQLPVFVLRAVQVSFFVLARLVCSWLRGRHDVPSVNDAALAITLLALLTAVSRKQTTERHQRVWFAAAYSFSAVWLAAILLASLVWTQFSGWAPLAACLGHPLLGPPLTIGLPAAAFCLIQAALTGVVAADRAASPPARAEEPGVEEAALGPPGALAAPARGADAARRLVTSLRAVQVSFFVLADLVYSRLRRGIGGSTPTVIEAELAATLVILLAVSVALGKRTTERHQRMWFAAAYAFSAVWLVANLLASLLWTSFLGLVPLTVLVRHPLLGPLVTIGLPAAAFCLIQARLVGVTAATRAVVPSAQAERPAVEEAPPRPPAPTASQERPAPVTGRPEPPPEPGPPAKGPRPGEVPALTAEPPASEAAPVPAVGHEELQIAPAPEPPGLTARVFISARSTDYEYAARLREFLTARGVPTFLSSESLPELGDSDYRRAIDQALDTARHMVVVISSAENAVARWVEAEWGFFVAEQRSGRKSGNLITVAVGSIEAAELPPSLRSQQVIPFGPEGFEQVLLYVKR